MKCKIPEISWHNRDPVLSVDIQPKNASTAVGFYRLASGGTDSHVLIWHVKFTDSGSELLLDVAADLSRHQRAVNAVKWSPNGELLASADDESVIFIWKQKGESEPLNILENSSEQDKEVWLTLKVLRGHMEDIYDLSWCPNSLYLVSGSVDNSAIIWDVLKGKSQTILSDHKGFVQGVAWDPKNQYIATLSTDRYLRIFDIQTKKALHRVNKAILPIPEGHALHGKRMRIYHDDTLQTYFRRLCFSPDGKLLFTPAGVTDYEGVTHPLNTSYIYSRYALRQPSVVLPCPDQYTVAIKCCPLLFKLRPHDTTTNPPAIPLPYRMIFAIATRSSVYLYDTQQQQPFGLISNIHYTRLTDITWSSDGCFIVVSSTDGFCSLITFERGELGEEYEDSVLVLAKNMEENPLKKKLKRQKENLAGAKKHTLHEDKIIVDPKTKSAEVRREEIDVISKQANPKATSVPVKEKPEEKDAVPTPSVQKIEKTVETNKSCAHEHTEVIVNIDGKPSAEIDSAPNTTKLHLGENIGTELIIDKEIISSDEKFESPGKMCRPVTPISVRRHPRTPSNATEDKFTKLAELSPLSSLAGATSPRQSKRATPIAVRHTPRALIPTPTIVNEPALLDEAVDAWPLADESLHEESKRSNKLIELTEVFQKGPTEAPLDCTEDDRIVYKGALNSSTEALEEKVGTANNQATANSSSVENAEHINTLKPLNSEINESNTPKQSQPNSANKTPRRVALTTLSTPKSKKKLID